MKLKVVLEQLEGKNVKLGSGVNFIYCGKVKDLSDIFEKEELKEEKRLEQMVDTWGKNVKYCENIIENENYNIKAIENMADMEEERKKSIIKGKKERLKGVEKDLEKNKLKLEKYTQLKKDFCPIYEREVIETYPSITEDATIIIFKGDEHGIYWNIKEYQRRNKGRG